MEPKMYFVAQNSFMLGLSGLTKMWCFCYVAFLKVGIAYFPLPGAIFLEFYLFHLAQHTFVLYSLRHLKNIIVFKVDNPEIIKPT